MAKKIKTIDAGLSHEEKILMEARDRLKKAMDEDYENRRLALEDLEFIGIEGAQWPANIRAEREADGRPCISINKMPIFIDQVVGDQRMNRPSIKVIPVDSKADPAIAEILGGWIKHVEQISKADTAIDHAFEHAVACGYGAMRVVTEFVSDDSFEQDARIQKIDNALAVFWGKHSEYDCSDAQYCFIITDMDRDEFRETYGEEPMPFNQADSRYIEGWCSANTVRVAEYFVKEPTTKTIYQLDDGIVVEKLEPWMVVAKKREVKSYKIKWYLLSGNKILDEKEWVGKKYIPVIPVWGKELNIGGRRKVRGLIRNAKDPQRMYNFWQSADTEMVALAPKAPYLATPKQIAGHETQWKEAHRKNFPYLLVNSDEQAPGFPKREIPPQVSSAMVEMKRETDQEIRDTIGLHRASLGMPSNERSGLAIRERKQEGDVGTFAFIDNLARSIEHLGRVLVDVAPGILDTERIIRLGLEGGLQKFEAVNVETTPDGPILHNLSVGTYDVVVTVGPSFTTQRTEARQSMSEFIQYYPQAAPLIGDLYAKSMDWPGADEMAERLEFLLPPEIREKKIAERAQNKGTPPPPPPAAPAPPPDPLLEAKIMEAQLKLQELSIQVEQEKVRLEGLQLDNQLKAVKGEQIATKIPARAEGGPVQEGQPYVVGEEGPEVMVPQTTGTIIPGDYDYESYIAKYGNLPDQSKGEHLSDEFKLPHHITFSDESIYSTPETPGGHRERNEMGKWVYTPSDFVLSLHPPWELRDYFNKYEPEAILNLPEEKKVIITNPYNRFTILK